jgi:hypothetical protein
VRGVNANFGVCILCSLRNLSLESSSLARLRAASPLLPAAIFPLAQRLDKR